VKLELKKELFNNLRIKKALKLMRSVDKDFCDYIAGKFAMGSDLRKFLFGRALSKLDYTIFIDGHYIDLRKYNEIEFMSLKDLLETSLDYGYEYVYEITPYDFRGL